MSTNPKYFIFTHWDLDGVASYLTVNWGLKQNNIPYVATTAMRFREDFIKWMLTNKTEDYDMIFITDLDVSSCSDLIDKKNIMIIDHHLSHEENVKKYQNATAIVKVYKSAAELVYKAFTKLYNAQYTVPQKTLILLASDYDSYALELPDSSKLNIIFWATNFKEFVNDFINGFSKFNVKQESIVKFCNEKIQQAKDACQVYVGKFNIQGKDRYVYATFADKWINELADYLMFEFKAEVAIVVNIKSKHVSFRRHPDVKDVNLPKLAVKLLGDDSQCGGHEYTAGGGLTDQFVEFTKLLKQIK